MWAVPGLKNHSFFKESAVCLLLLPEDLAQTAESVKDRRQGHSCLPELRAGLGSGARILIV